MLLKLCAVLCSSLFEVFPTLRQELKGCSPVGKPTALSWAWFEPLREGLILTQWALFPYENVALVYNVSFGPARSMQ